ncbi:glycosyltransferase [Phocaeicola coprocola]|jgi:UDP-N-acetylglucosamine transferase subunit ALG13|uniref:glycosyltransferase n=1 Tax=Phocaeicola coprocola TaxID=310298 RepID=UPI0015B5F307
MIFVTIGTQAPFDRFIKMVDEIAANLNEEVIAQTFKSQYKAKKIKTVDFLAPDEFNKLFKEARMIVAHAGMGTIISAMQHQKPIIIFPRIAALGEHRNEHQMATAKKMKELGYVHVAFNEKELKDLLLSDNINCLHKLSDSASPTLINSLSDYINQIN